MTSTKRNCVTVAIVLLGIIKLFIVIVFIMTIISLVVFVFFMLFLMGEFYEPDRSNQNKDFVFCNTINIVEENLLYRSDIFNRQNLYAKCSI